MADLDCLETFILAGQFCPPDHMCHCQFGDLFLSHFFSCWGQMKVLSGQFWQSTVSTVDLNAQLKAQIWIVAKMRNMAAFVEIDWGEVPEKLMNEIIFVYSIETWNMPGCLDAYKLPQFGKWANGFGAKLIYFFIPHPRPIATPIRQCWAKRPLRWLKVD